MDESDVREFLAVAYPRVVAGLTLICDSRAAAEDTVQEALARAWERSERGERIESLRAWVVVVATNLARSGLRRARAERRARDRIVTAHARPAGQAASDDRVDVRRALASLSRRQREATVLRYYLDLSVTDVARALGVTEGTAKTTLHRARQALAAALGEEAEDAPDPDDGNGRLEEANDGADR